MTENPENHKEETAVDDVRRVREKIAEEHGGDFQKHIEETNRIAAELRQKLNIRVVPVPTTHSV